jgi:hypothetical protein
MISWFELKKAVAPLAACCFLLKTADSCCFLNGIWCGCFFAEGLMLNFSKIGLPLRSCLTTACRKITENYRCFTEVSPLYDGCLMDASRNFTEN